MRNKLVKLLIEKGIRDRLVLKAIGTVPRHLFLDSGFEDFAYQDRAFPIGAEQTISHPYTVAFQSEKMGLKTGDKVLEVGTGSGYQAAVLVAMGVKVYSIERQKELFEFSKMMLNKLDYHINQVFGDGYIGWPQYAPFDGIIVTAGAPYIPKPLLAQLKVGARLVIPVGDKEQRMKVITRNSEDDFSVEDHGDFRFVPMLQKRNS